MLFWQFVCRNIKLYFRDRAGVFFSFLATIIVLALMIAFLGEGNVATTMDVLGIGVEGEQEHAASLIIIWTIAGIVVVNAVSVSMVMVGTMVRDEETHKLSAFLVAPVRRSLYVTGYVVSAVLVAFLMCIVTLLIGEVYIACTGGEMISVKQTFEALLILLAIIFSSASFVFLCATLVHTASAFNGLTTVVSTLIGFLAAIYVPFGAMPWILQKGIRFVPAFQGSSALRQVLMGEDIAWFACDEAYKAGYADYMGLVIQVGEHMVSPMEKVLCMLVAGFILLGIATWRLYSNK